MRTLVAWTLTLAVGSLAFDGRAEAQSAYPPAAPAPAQTPAQRKATAPAQGQAASPAPAAGKSAAASKPAAPLDPATIKAQQEAQVKARKEMDLLLAEWENQSKKITSLNVAFDRIKTIPGWGDEYSQGRALLKSPDLAVLEFRKYKLDAQGKPATVPGKDGQLVVPLEADPDERIVCNGKQVLHYTWDSQTVFVYPLDAQSRQKALQEGPLPFLFNMKAAEAKQRYGMTLVNQDEKQYVIAIIPNEDIDRQSFRQATLCLSKETFLPNRLVLYPPEKKGWDDYRFTGRRLDGGANGIKANQSVDDSYFAFAKYPKWTTKVVENGDAGAPAPGRLMNGAQPANPGGAARPKVTAPAPPQGAASRPLPGRSQ